MPQDPFHGRAPSEGGPYDNAMTVTRAEGDTLPVIPSAFYLPPVLVDDANGAPSYEGGQNPYSMYQVCVEMQNGAEILIRTAGFNDHTGTVILNPMRIRKILWGQSPGLQAVTLLW